MRKINQSLKQTLETISHQAATGLKMRLAPHGAGWPAMRRSNLTVVWPEAPGTHRGLLPRAAEMSRRLLGALRSRTVDERRHWREAEERIGRLHDLALARSLDFEQARRWF